MKSPLFLVVALLGLSGCATPYQRIDVSGGYEDARLGDNVFRVSFHGNGYSSRERVADLALLRSAAVTLAHGYRYFVRIDEDAYLHYGTITPALTRTGSQKDAGGFRFRGQTYTFGKIDSSHLIACYREPPQGLAYYEAEKVARLLQRRYAIGDAEGLPDAAAAIPAGSGS